MEQLYTGKEYAAILHDIFLNNDTFYAWGAWGAYAGYAGNKDRYKVSSAPDDCFLFDCSGFAYKAIPWGWNGSRTKNGGASYKKEGFEALETNDILAICSDVSEDFEGIQIGEVVYLPGHVGIYIGSGEVIECTSAWENGVMITACDNVGGSKIKYHRVWSKHGKLPFIKYEVSENAGPDEAEMINEIDYGFSALETAEDEINEAIRHLTAARTQLKLGQESFDTLENLIEEYFGGLKK